MSIEAIVKQIAPRDGVEATDRYLALFESSGESAAAFLLVSTPNDVVVLLLTMAVQDTLWKLEQKEVKGPMLALPAVYNEARYEYLSGWDS